MIYVSKGKRLKVSIPIHGVVDVRARVTPSVGAIATCAIYIDLLDGNVVEINLFGHPGHFGLFGKLGDTPIIREVGDDE